MKKKHSSPPLPIPEYSLRYCIGEVINPKIGKCKVIREYLPYHKAVTFVDGMEYADRQNNVKKEYRIMRHPDPYNIGRFMPV